MSYKIAIASSDGVNINESFGSAGAFHIFDVTDQNYVKSEIRNVSENVSEKTTADDCSVRNNCSGGGCNGGGGGCSGNNEASEKVNLVADCRCVVCEKIGFHIRKQLERKAITAFDVSCTVNEALEKITSYFYKVDTHQSFRGTASHNSDT